MVRLFKLILPFLKIASDQGSLCLQGAGYSGGGVGIRGVGRKFDLPSLVAVLHPHLIHSIIGGAGSPLVN